ncbi:MAG: hypothetical protein N5P05_001482 [Chroococcopsis gigantea SAG 12.99]|jgi:predicted alpha/beta-fold hydrolase|nr:alpha/beta fold hydrolase [Chlorogloea purpurea SAG 13.99]MDV2999876.1 hypothetical protein [Chroococcopsis gigantea SAG 12.99]
MVYQPPALLKNGLAMTLYVALKAKDNWPQTITELEPSYQFVILTGAQSVPIYALVAIPENPKATIVATYGITGDLGNQWFLQILARLAYQRNYALILFDWRAHGKTADLSPTLTSDGIYEGLDYLHLAAEGKKLGCPAPFWFTGYSLGGQLALWGIKESQEVHDLNITPDEIGGGAVICPNLDSNRSLTYLLKDRWGKHLEKAIVKQLKELGKRLHASHPDFIDPEAVKRANTIRGFDHELVIDRLGFSSVEEYYDASSPLPFLSHLSKPTLILYAADDPMFDPTIIPDLQRACRGNNSIDLQLTSYGGHVGYISAKSCQRDYGDSSRWWAWHRVLDFFDRFSS